MFFRKLVLVAVVATAAGRLASQTPTWAENIAPILYQNCTGCHVEGGIAPWSLVGYSAAKTYAYSVKSATQSRRMPPWPADPEYRRYAHEKILSTEEIQTIADWVDNGMPEGDPGKAPAPPKAKTETSIFMPDMKLKMPDYEVNTISDEYRCFVLPTGLSVNKFLTEIEVVPGNLSVVHHVLVFHDTSSIPLQLDNNDPKPGYLGFGGTGSPTSKMIGVWVPGQDPFKMPPGMGIKLEKNGYIILQVHYPGNVHNIVDSSKVYFKLTTQSLREVGIAPALNHLPPSLQNGPLYIPANQKKEFTAKYTIPIDISVFAVAPHMHMVGKSIRAFGVKTPGDTNRLISIPGWDFHWQRTYSFAKVQKISQGTVLWANAGYDNTSANPMNPNSPPQAVSLGEGTGDEMLLVYFWYTLYLNGDENIVIDPNAPKNISSTVIIEKPPVKIYPNPTENTFSIEGWRGDPMKLLCHLYSSDGRLIRACDYSVAEGTVQIDISDVPTGMYFIQLKDASTLRAYRIVKH